MNNEIKFNIPKQIGVGKNPPFIGYISIDGKIYKCEKYQYDNLIRDIVFNNFINEYKKIPVGFYYEKPLNMLQEEYFAMKYLGFAKIDICELNMSKYSVYYYDELSKKQQDIIYKNVNNNITKISN